MDPNLAVYSMFTGSCTAPPAEIVKNLGGRQHSICARPVGKGGLRRGLLRRRGGETGGTLLLQHLKPMGDLFPEGRHRADALAGKQTAVVWEEGRDLEE